ncbi:NADH:flavin oxidoreductase/NADH oxidase family protein [Psychrobacter sp. HD31]|uniref:NADH:flavin oxidoreductase/NADH oxidase family protein n=1 Tax=Psychrobacter sp. HD31 TaxID=3112003 RepID=UPI003DA4E494
MDSINVTNQISLRGHVFKNRFAKGAMSEALANEAGEVNDGLINLYRIWAEGGLGCAITGNVMIDWRAKNEPGVVVVEDEHDLPMLAKWAATGKAEGMITIVQLSHPGKQCPTGLNEETVAPSAVPFHKDMQAIFPTPRALTTDEIHNLIERFAESARICEKAGFEGVQIHGAHGYLVSEFLSPHHNRRSDEWGGSIENRMRFLTESVKAIQAKTTDNFILSVKLNSADFQRGGFSESDSLIVIKELEKLGVDFVEISGGNYEAPAMTGAKQSTKEREAYFIDFAAKVREQTSIPLMVTGGFRTREGMDNALQSNACDFIGVGRPLAIEPDACNKWLAGNALDNEVKPIKTGIRAIDRGGVMEIIWYAKQFKRMARNQAPDPQLSPKKVFAKYMLANTINRLKGKAVFGRLRAKQ